MLQAQNQHQALKPNLQPVFGVEPPGNTSNEGEQERQRALGKGSMFG